MKQKQKYLEENSPSLFARIKAIIGDGGVVSMVIKHPYLEKYLIIYS